MLVSVGRQIQKAVKHQHKPALPEAAIVSYVPEPTQLRALVSNPSPTTHL